MIVRNRSVTYSIFKRAFRPMRMHLDLCLTLVDVKQNEVEITSFIYVLCDADPPSVGEGSSWLCTMP